MIRYNTSTGKIQAYGSSLAPKTGYTILNTTYSGDVGDLVKYGRVESGQVVIPSDLSSIKTNEQLQTGLIHVDRQMRNNWDRIGWYMYDINFLFTTTDLDSALDFGKINYSECIKAAKGVQTYEDAEKKIILESVSRSKEEYSTLDYNGDGDLDDLRMFWLDNVYPSMKSKYFLPFGRAIDNNFYETFVFI